jgi:hypothetical protein
MVSYFSAAKEQKEKSTVPRIKYDDHQEHLVGKQMEHKMWSTV